MTSQCPLCRAGSLQPFQIFLQRAMRSDGLIVDEPLAKDNCNACGALVGRNTQPKAPYRRTEGLASSEIARHARIAQGLRDEILRRGIGGPILELGAASFQTALHLAKDLPDWPIVAVEPEPEHVPNTANVEIHVGTLADLHQPRSFGLVYSNHVLEHVPDTRDFLRQIAEVLAPDGTALLSCPSGLLPSHELLFADHLYHFTPRALAVAARDVGLALIDHIPTPWEPLSRLFILGHRRVELPDAPDNLTPQRRAYFAAWEGAEEALLASLHNELILFGAGEFSQLIRAYLPRIYQRVTIITLDDPKGARHFDKPILPLSQLDLRGRTVLLGTHPASASAVAARLSALGAAHVTSLPLP